MGSNGQILRVAVIVVFFLVAYRCNGVVLISRDGRVVQVWVCELMTDVHVVANGLTVK